MKAKVALIILIVTTLGLGIALLVVSTKATKYKENAQDSIAVLSNSVATLEKNLDLERNDKMMLLTNLVETRTDFSNKLTATETTLSTTTASLAKAQADAKAAAEAAAAEITQRDKKINDLESQNQALDKRAADLSANITNLEVQISATEKKLAASNSDRDFLLKELKRLQTEKADLEKKFNDLAVLREQVRKLKDELALSRRLDWIRRGLYTTSGLKGGERMISARPSETDTNGLNVELRQDGGSKIERVTNAPAAK